MHITIVGDGLEIPGDEAKLCSLYRDVETSAVSAESYLFSELLAERPSLCAEIRCGEQLALSVEGAHWSLTSWGQSRLAGEASLLKERWTA